MINEMPGGDRPCKNQEGHELSKLVEMSYRQGFIDCLKSFTNIIARTKDDVEPHVEKHVHWFREYFSKLKEEI